MSHNQLKRKEPIQKTQLKKQPIVINNLKNFRKKNFGITMLCAMIDMV